MNASLSIYTSLRCTLKKHWRLPFSISCSITGFHLLSITTCNNGCQAINVSLDVTLDVRHNLSWQFWYLTDDQFRFLICCHIKFVKYFLFIFSTWFFLTNVHIYCVHFKPYIMFTVVWQLINYAHKIPTISLRM